MNDGTRTEDRVLDVARRQLGEMGPSALSLRAIAREVGVVPSALYRYYPGRDAILTGLIRTGYSRLGDSVEQAVATCSRDDLLGRWTTTWAATRAWAVDHPHEYALLYGTPVVGYKVPPDTVGPATRVVALLAQVALDSGVSDTGYLSAATSPRLSPQMRDDAARIRAELPSLGLRDPIEATDETILGVVEAWTTLFGAVSFELFGHYVGSIEHAVDYLDRLARQTFARLGLGVRS